MVPIQITCRDFPLTAAIRRLVRQYVDNLEKFYSRIIRCEVVLSAPHKHRQKGRVFHVSLRLNIPGQDLAVSREAEEDPSHEKFHLALHDAFRAMDRRLEDRVRKMRRYVKTPETNPRGRVVRILPDDEHGFVETPEGDEIYFHKNSLLSGQFDKLKVGTKVQYHLEAGEKGPQVSSMHIVGRKSRAAPIQFPYVRRVG